MTSFFSGADGETEVVTVPRELVCAGLHLLLGGGSKGTVFDKQEVSGGCLFHLGDCLLATLVEQFPICPVSDESSFLTVTEGVSEHGAKHSAEVCRS